MWVVGTTTSQRDISGVPLSRASWRADYVRIRRIYKTINNLKFGFYPYIVL